MKKNLLFFTGPLLLLVSLLLISSSELYTEADYVGSAACAGCHFDKHESWAASGHPYKFSVTPANEGPVYPVEAVNFQSQWMDSLGDGSHTWDDVAGVIGGYGWKARFVGIDGHLIGTAGSSLPDSGVGHNQFNFYGGEDHGWVDYHPGDEKIYNYGCFKCHTTGGDTAGTWLAGVDGLGTFTEGGVGCESCHGPGSAHIASQSADDIDKVYEFAHQDNAIGGLEIDGVVQTPDPNGNDVNFLCGTCHNRDYKDPINSGGGFIKHHEQWDEFMAAKHGKSGLTCITCHNPHKRVIWDGDGITATCESCHPNQAALINHSGTTNCIDCHMPFAAKSGTTRGQSGFVGDVRSHLMSITPDTASMFTLDGAWVRDDSAREASLSPAYACLGCHNNDPEDGIPEKTLEAAALSAAGMHTATSVSQHAELSLGIYPNPSSGPTVITFTLARAENVTLRVFNSTGQMVYQLSDVRRPAGSQLIQWNGTSNTGAKMESGYYFVKLTAGNLSSVQKLVMMR
ncbi:MAG: T9SS type A sorting domain-containing protein [Bacteroidales bacterium]|nr:T9SS type A sorting domain-containing protein [Bacteroidales bacterium]